MKMDKFKILILATVVFTFMSCDEQTPPGLDLGGQVLAEDSVFLAPVEIPQPRAVMMEELTGAGCSNCPEAASIIEGLINANPGRLYAAALHPPKSGFTEPIFEKSVYNFRTPKADDIALYLGDIPSMPSAATNRIHDASTVYFRSKANWSGIINDALSKQTPVNIHLTSSYDSEDNICTVTAQVAFTQDVPDDVNLTIYVTENDVIDYQLDGNNYVPDYEFDHIFRDCITNIQGNPLNLGGKTAGTVMQKRFEFQPIITGDNAWVVDNCNIIAFVNKVEGVDKEILHTAEVHMK